MTNILNQISEAHEKGVPLDSALICSWRDVAGDTLLHQAIWKEWWSIVPILLKQGLSPNIQNKEGETALHILFEKAQDWDFLHKSDLKSAFILMPVFFQYDWDFEIKNNHQKTAFEVWQQMLNCPSRDLLSQEDWDHFWQAIGSFEEASRLNKNLKKNDEKLKSRNFL